MPPLASRNWCRKVSRAVCHTRGRSHLEAPERLWDGSRQVLGEVAEIYGRPQPVPRAALASYEELADEGIETIETPGHAPHHLSFLHRGTLFLGEAAGTFQALDDGRWYLRPATPPRFFLDVATASVDRLLERSAGLKRAAFGHYGLHGDVAGMLTAARAQMTAWVGELESLTAPGRRVWSPELQEKALQRLMDTDPLFAPFTGLDKDIQLREIDFFRNTLDGMLGWLHRCDVNR